MKINYFLDNTLCKNYTLTYCKIFILYFILSVKNTITGGIKWN